MTAGGDSTDMRTLTSIDEISECLRTYGDRLYLRWSRGPHVDRESVSRDELTGIELPGLCANPLNVEEWWEDRPLDLWVARRVYDYRHLQEDHGPDVRPWLLVGTETGRGPDNEPLVRLVEPLAWLSEAVVQRCDELVAAADDEGVWGSMRRHG